MFLLRIQFQLVHMFSKNNHTKCVQSCEKKIINSKLCVTFSTVNYGKIVPLTQLPSELKRSNCL